MSIILIVLLAATVATCEGAKYVNSESHKLPHECRKYGKPRPALDAPVYSPGKENLSFEKCGQWDGSGDMPWTVIIGIKLVSNVWSTQPMPSDVLGHHSYGFLVTKQTMMVFFNQMNTEIENYQLYAGPCSSGPNNERCLLGRGLLNQRVLSRNGDQVWKIEKITITQHLRPICLWNRNNFQDSAFESFVFSQTSRTLNKTELLNDQQCYLSNKLISPQVCSEMDSLLCTNFEHSGMFLVMKDANRYYLRATRWGNFLLPDDRLDDRILWIDILRNIKQIVSVSTGLFLMPPTPKLATKIDFGPEESYADCGKVTGNRRRGRQRRDGVAFSFVHHGENAPIEQNPWHASLTINLPDPLYDVCGGTLVSKRVVVTAAHCLYNPTGTQYETKLLEIVLGMYDATDDEEIGRQVVKAASVVIHQDYDHGRNDFQHDLALIILNENSIQFTDRVKPACLWNSDYDFEKIAGKSGKVAGFGLTAENYSQARFLQKAFLRIAPHNECFSFNKKFFAENWKPTLNFCAGFPDNGTNVCNGDSGGGLLIADVTSAENKRFYLRGIVSFGSSQIKTVENSKKRVCNPYHYAMFLDITSYMSWIVQNSPDISPRR
ncbi:uncharacterized protein LOC135943304 [Cloeon dipterum]|uniref:uncharacterized protein LOC135943304 n=1 Tax=Cloeon dipterum TaxID=197152 RepID=UPI00321FB397